MSNSLRGPALYKAVFDYIKQYIIDHNLNPGDALLSEGQLVDELGVGRSSVREAVKSLQSVGIIDVQHGNGLFVRELNFDSTLATFKFGMQFDARTVAELIQIRIWLETAVIGDAVDRISQSDLDRLDLLLEKWETCIAKGRGYIELDEEFHHILYAVLENETLMPLFDAFWVAFASLENNAIPDADPYDELQTHHRILDAVKSRDVELARKQLVRHFQSGQKWVKRYIELANAEKKANSI